MSQLFDETKQFIDEDTNTLLVGGLLYIGLVGLDAKLNPKDVFDNRELTGAALAQPLVLGADGSVPVKGWVSGKYSFKVENSAGVQKDDQLQNGFDEAVGNIQTTNSLGVNDITATGVPVQTSYTDNKQYIVTAPADNTGAMTIDLDAIGVIDIRKGHDQALTSGDVLADMKLALIYNSTDNWMELQSAVLGSVFGGSISVGGDLDFTGTTPAITTVSNEDLDVTPNGTGEFQYNGDEVDVKRTIATDHVRAGNNQSISVDSDAGFTPDITISSLTTAGVWETFGPTGSGATNEWTAMDFLPSTARVLIVNADILLSNSGSSVAGVNLYACDGDITTPTISLTNRKIWFEFSNGTGSDTGIQYFISNLVFIPLNSSQIFKSTWNTANTTLANAGMVYQGFLTD
jgi:hypothetical protein